jgi:hypothetical protein
MTKISKGFFGLSEILDDALVLPWVWRGWAYIIFPAYRVSRRRAWAEASVIYKTVDVFLSLICMASWLVVAAIFAGLLHS